MRKKYVCSLVAVASVLCVLGVTGIVSNANESEVRRYTDQHGNKVIEFLNPVDPGNEPAAPVEEHPLSMGTSEVQGDLMTINENQVVKENQPVQQEQDIIEDESIVQDNNVAVTQIEPAEDGIVPDIATNVITYTDKHGNKVTEYINPVDPGNEPATMPGTVPSTQGNIQGDIMTLDEPMLP